MATSNGVRETPGGKFELTLSHKLLPKRKFYTFNSRVEAEDYGAEARRLLAAGIVPASVAQVGPLRMSVLIQRWRNTERLSKTDDTILPLVIKDLGDLELSGFTYQWCEKWVQTLKLKNHLAPSTIRQRVQALSRALDWHIRSSPGVINPLKLLPRGYSVYSEGEGKKLKAAGLDVKRDIVRERRLLAGEEQKIRTALAGDKKGQRVVGSELALIFELILQTGVRLREAYTVRKEHVNLKTKVLKIQSTKQRNGDIVYRDVPMRPALYEALAHVKGKGLLFDFWDGDPDTLTKVTARLSQRFANLFEYAGCKALREHDLRHEATCRWFEEKTAAGWMFRAAEINRIMGWAPNSTMAARYASFRVESLAERLWQ